MKKFLFKNKVIVIGLLSSIALAVSELVKGGEASVKVIVFSGLIAAASWAANNLRGQAASIIGIFGSALATYLTMIKEGQVSYAQLILTLVISILGVYSSPAKSSGYEKTEIIREAKKEGEVIQPTIANPVE